VLMCVELVTCIVCINTLQEDMSYRLKINGLLSIKGSRILGGCLVYFKWC
jgi:hypothetical protein